jgi:CMP/dCMP kinase
MPLTIAIDGPAGSGKSTVAKRLARLLGLRFLDTGAMYRCVALLAQRAGLGPDDGEEAARLAECAEIAFREGDPQRVLLSGEDVTEAIRSGPVGELASALSAHSAVRRVLTGRQKQIVAAGGYTLEGRDTTTVIAPDAEVKVFLTASVAVRARRRWEELRAKGEEADLAEVERSIAERDHRDSTRADSPLRVAEDALVLDTSDLTVDEVVERICAQVRSVQGSGIG